MKMCSLWDVVTGPPHPPVPQLPIATDPIIKWAATRWPTYVVRYSWG